MISQVSTLSGVGPASAGLAAGESSAPGADSSPLSVFFGDLLTGMTLDDTAPGERRGLETQAPCGEDAPEAESAIMIYMGCATLLNIPATPEPDAVTPVQSSACEGGGDLQGEVVHLSSAMTPGAEGTPEAVAPGIPALIASLQSAAGAPEQPRAAGEDNEVADDTGLQVLQTDLSTDESHSRLAAASAVFDGAVAEVVAERRWQLRAMTPNPSTTGDTAMPESVPVSLESRLTGSESVIAAVASSPATSSVIPPGSIDALQSLATTGQPPAGADAQGGSALAAGLQASASDRPLDVAAGRLPQPAPLPPQEFRAAVSQTLEQVAWMSREGVHQARLQLEPAHLGRVDIWLDLEAGEARLHLGAQQAHVREALEAVLPRLRDALAEQGMTLTDASVSHSGRDDASGESGRGDHAGSSAGFGEGVVAADQADSPLHDMSASGLLDIYA